MSNSITKKDVQNFNNFIENINTPQCTCQDRGVYIGGKYFIFKATTEFESCKVCNPGTKND